MDGRRVVVLGGGVGGVTAANELRAVLGSEHRVILMERQRDHVFAPSFLWLMTGDRRADQVRRKLSTLLRKGVELVEAEVTGLDLDREAVLARGQEYRYDALVVALGAELDPASFPGYADAAFNFFDAAGAARLATALKSFAGGRIVVAVTALPYKCPAAPYEAALLIEDQLRRRGLRPRSEVAIFTPEPQPMPVAGPAMGAAVSQLLAERGIQLNTTRALASIDAGAHELVFTDGARERFDLLAAVPPHRAPEVVRRSALAAASGWIPVDAATLRTKHEKVYAIGDVASITLGNGKPLPKAGVFAHAEARVVAREIAASFGGTAAPAFDGKGYCWVELGSGRAAFADGDFYASPAPTVLLRKPGTHWHLGKVLFERSWLGTGLERALAAAALRVGARLTGVRSEV
ncbi:MAG TPA: FAD/NAD(P)-binding oxidoreductase [Candidatus Limnocylindria bacterium]|nr:FAD/NAD(P)-binding oxidoreductase [Candidatus Limnocylindria bacterium]